MLRPAGIEDGIKAGRITVILASSFGMMFLARYALGFLAPQLQPDLHLRPSHLGLLAALLAAGWSLSGWLASRHALQLTSIRNALAALLLILALASVAASGATGIVWLAACALVFGIAGGPVLPLIQSITMRIVGKAHRGLVMGLVQSAGGSVIAKIVGPLLLIPCAERFGWRVAFMAIAAAALLITIIVRVGLPAPRAIEPHQESPGAAAEGDQPSAGHETAGNRRNVAICCCIGGLMVAWLMMTTSFYPLYLTNNRGFSPFVMGELIATAGSGSLFGVVIVPWVSDFIGRRAAITMFALLGTVAPLALLSEGISESMLGAFLFTGSLAGGVFPLFMSIVPAESVPARAIAKSISAVQAVSEMIGGVAIPLAIGYAANVYGLKIPVVGAFIATLATGLLALAIQPCNGTAARKVS